MKRLVPLSTVGLAGVVSVGLLSLQAPGVVAQDGDQFVKREEEVAELELVDDDDDDRDSNSNDTSRFTGFSRSTRDHTRSNFTRVSRDRDWSRSDKTRDWTDDGHGPKKRDWSALKTNDRSRNDTRR
jgi:hypothetical protein